ncbi:MAG TPA: ABC transporter permease [Acetobacteraceae bacterium]|jgi:ribose transport system permease protein|nr:ABC transporter permease [Acetobacteraceae bacterium]
MTGGFARGVRRSGVLPVCLMLVVMIALNAWLQPRFFGYASLESNIATFAPSILVCAAQAIVVLNRQLDLSVGAGISLINCALAVLPPDLPGGSWTAAGAAMALAVAMGLVNGTLVAVLGLPPLIATFATGAVWFGLALALLPQPGGSVHPDLGEVYAAEWLGVPAPLLIVAAAMAAWTLLARHRVGRWIVAVGSNPAAAFQAGIRVRWTTLGAFVAAWVLVALSALSISAQTLSGDARLGQTYTLTSVAAVVLGGISLSGGRGSPWGAVLGALVLGIIANVIYFAGMPSIWQEFFKGLVIMAALGLMVLGQTPRRVT